MSTVVAIAFTPSPAADSPNLHSAAKDPLRTFHSLINLCFSSLRRWNPELTLVLVTTMSPGVNLERQLNELDADILLTPFSHEPPPGFFPTFNASLFSIDALACLAKTYAEPTDRIVLLDPDVVCCGSLEHVFNSIPQSGFLTYDTEYDPDYLCQGLSAVTAAELHKQLDPTLNGLPRHYGGELYGFNASSWHTISARVEESWKFSLYQWRNKLPRFVTEEHLMNYALRYTTTVSAEPYIRRIWTAPTSEPCVQATYLSRYGICQLKKTAGLQRCNRSPETLSRGSGRRLCRTGATGRQPTSAFLGGTPKDCCGISQQIFCAVLRLLQASGAPASKFPNLLTKLVFPHF